MSFADWGTPKTALAGLRWLALVVSLLLVRDTECSLESITSVRMWQMQGLVDLGYR